MDEEQEIGVEPTQQEQTVEPTEVEQTSFTPPPSHKKLIVGVVVTFVLVVGGIAGAYFLFQPKAQPVDSIQPVISAGDIEQGGVVGDREIQPIDHKEYFYYYNEEKILLKFVGIQNGYPTFRVSDSEGVAKSGLMILTDEFAVKLKRGATLEDLEDLNRKYGVTIAKQISDTNDQFLLMVKNNPQTNALDTANEYHNEDIIEWAEPNFIQQYSR